MTVRGCSVVSPGAPGFLKKSRPFVASSVPRPPLEAAYYELVLRDNSLGDPFNTT
jgi:hypothetical protein